MWHTGPMNTKVEKQLTDEEYIEDCKWGIIALTSLLAYHQTYGISELGREIIYERIVYLSNLLLDKIWD